jgi:hypothetical protein
MHGSSPFANLASDQSVHGSPRPVQIPTHRISLSLVRAVSQVSGQALPCQDDRQFRRPRRKGPGHPIARQRGHVVEVRSDPIRETWALQMHGERVALFIDLVGSETGDSSLRGGAASV